MKAIFVVDEGNLTTIAEIPLDDVPLHAAHFEGPIFQIIARFYFCKFNEVEVLTIFRSGVYRICCKTRSVEKVETCANLLELLKDAAEPMPITYKNVAYNNAEQYFERKVILLNYCQTEMKRRAKQNCMFVSIVNDCVIYIFTCRFSSYLIFLFDFQRTKFEEIAKGDRTRKGKKKNSNGKQDAQGMDESAESVQA